MKNEAHNLLADFLSNIEKTAIFIQLAVLCVCLLLAWSLYYVISTRLLKNMNLSKIVLGNVSRVIFPLFSLLLLLVGKEILKQWYSIGLLNIFIPLLFVLLVVRLLVYALRQVFTTSYWLRGYERFIAAAIWLGFALYLTGLIPDIKAAMSDWAFEVGAYKISFLNIFNGVISISITLLIAMWLARMVERKILASEHLEMNYRVVMSKLTSAVFVVIGILIALTSAGIDITVLSVFGGALGVGIGFGLQKIASNYVSGFIILLDRSIHPGDILTVDGRFGKVSHLTTRYMVLKGTDGTESIIPNETLVSSTVINHSYSDRKIRINIPLQISYQSNLPIAMEIMKQAAIKQPRVVNDPEVKVYLKSFGDNGIDLELSI
jgi:small-conductance mechanosensitive channel